ncbi:MAG: peptide chain release factor 1 [Rickettsiales bacterium]|jgi:peptide chain release factor 1|nr:peptide chain release factor 1 [Rickettsiales bacterium]
MDIIGKLQQIEENYQRISKTLEDPSALSREEFVEISKEYAELEPIVSEYIIYKSLVTELEELKDIIADSNNDAEMISLASDEVRELETKISEMKSGITKHLIPKDKDDAKNAILEIRAGTGGGEAALFASDLLKMYQKYSEHKKWKFEVMAISGTEIGGCREATISITGKDVFSRLKFESGVHRVQRVPETESSGRVHTSAATVAVLPEAEDIDIQIEEKDLRIDIFRASGPGGQSVNTTDSAVRIVHIPTGITVSQQDQKSQHKNKEKGMKILKARLYEHKRQLEESSRSEERRSQIGSGDRSERIRTYNFPQSRISDHRINLTLYKIEEIMANGELDYLIDPLLAEDAANKLANIN